MNNFLITNEFPHVATYIVAVEDEYGFVPLYAYDNFDDALLMLRVMKYDPIYHTYQTDKLFAAM